MFKRSQMQVKISPWSQRFMRAAGSVLLAATVFSIFMQAARAQGLPDRIKIGLMYSASGPNAAAQISNVLAVRMALKEMGDQGGIGGKPFDVVLADDQSL